MERVMVAFQHLYKHLNQFEINVFLFGFHSIHLRMVLPLFESIRWGKYISNFVFILENQFFHLKCAKEKYANLLSNLAHKHDHRIDLLLLQTMMLASQILLVHLLALAHIYWDQQ